MVEFETLDSKEVKFGANNFIEVSRKKRIENEKENIFVSLSRGFYAPDGSKRYMKNFTIPDDPEVLEKISKFLEELKK